MNQQMQVSALERPLGQSTASPRLEGNWLRAARLGWIILALVALGILLTSLPGYAPKFSGQLGHVTAESPSTSAYFFAAASAIVSLSAALLSLGLSVMLFRRRFEEPIAAALAFYLLVYGIVMAGPLEHWGAYWVGEVDFVTTLESILLATPTILLFALFPNGRFVPPWMRWVVIISVAWSISLVFLPSINALSISQNPFLFSLVAIWFASFTVLGIYAQIYRYRRVSTREERQQTKWVVFGFALWVIYIVISTGPYFYITGLPPDAPIPWWVPVSELGWWLSLSIIPLSLTIAITRQRLWNIDLVINRTLVYGALTLTTMALYIFVVGALSNLLQTGDNYLIAFLTTGLVAVLFQPLRARLQRWVNRLMYGERDDPVAVLSKLGEELEHTGSPEDTLSSITESVAQTLKLPYVAIELGESNEIVASYGLPKSEEYRLPMLYQTEISGYLVVAPRSSGEAFSASDRQLLENIAHQAGAAAHAAKLTADLRLSRQRLVTAREEERRRLRRDLHDGLGPTLASLTLKMDATRNVLRSDPEKAERLLEELKKQTQGTIQDIRNLVYELRPPALDELGLIGAIQSFIDRHVDSQTQITLEVSDHLPQLPAAFEVAVYRIALEGLTNVIRHASADTAVVHIALINDQLHVEIHDDGSGLPENYSAGVGLASMQERAEELGGILELIPQKPGTLIRARLPLFQE